MEHITVIVLANGYKQLTPDEGYALYNIRTQRVYSVAVVKDTNTFIAIEA